MRRYFCCATPDRIHRLKSQDGKDDANRENNRGFSRIGRSIVIFVSDEHADSLQRSSLRKGTGNQISGAVLLVRQPPPFAGHVYQASD